MSSKKIKLIIALFFFLIVFFIIFFSTLSLFNQNDQKNGLSDEYHLQSGLRYISWEQYDLAMKEFEVAININPNNYRAQFELATLLFFFNDLKRAEEHYIIATSFEAPSNIRARSYYELSRIYSMQSDYEKAIIYGQKALEEELENEIEKAWIKSLTYPIMAISHFYMGNEREFNFFVQKSLEYIERDGLLEREIEIATKINLYNILGFHNLLVQGNFNVAIEYFEKMMKIGDDNANAAGHYGIGKVYFTIGNYEEALDHFYTALNLVNSRNEFLLIGIYSDLAKTHLQLNECEEVRGKFNEVARRLDGSTTISDYMIRYEKAAIDLALGECSFREGKSPEETIAILEKSLSHFINLGKDSFKKELLYNTFFITINYRIAQIQYQNNLIQEARERIIRTSQLIDSLSPEMIDIITRVYWPREETLILDNIQELKSSLGI